ncbi:hypothetical protein [Moorena sp. SIO4G3]|nr:hypothetical protein [Moorena sp. SIO4G3]
MHVNFCLLPLANAIASSAIFVKNKESVGTAGSVGSVRIFA